MKLKLLLAVIIGWGAFLTACASRPLLLETKDALNFSVTEQSKGGTAALILRGLVLHSAYAVEKVTVNLETKTLTVKISLCKARAGLSGSFDSMVVVPDDVTTVLMGKDRVKIWSRAGGSLFPASDER